LSRPVPKASDLPERVGREIVARLRELRPFVDEYEDLLAVEQTLGVEMSRDVPTRAPARARAKKPSEQRVDTAPLPTAKRERAPRGAAAEAIVAALEHGSHTVSELAIVTAMSGQNIRNNLRRLLQAGAVRQTKREGKTAYALSSPKG
jgi:DNA-binding transcriptional ArsR family regulator